jgi:hypothetical protein
LVEYKAKRRFDIGTPAVGREILVLRKARLMNRRNLFILKIPSIVDQCML